MRLDLGYLKRYTRHPYAVVIPQILTEDVLGTSLASLGVSVHRPLRVVGLTRNTENGELTDVTFEDGKVITAKYVVGADGARSVVRSCLKWFHVKSFTCTLRSVRRLVLGSVIR